MKAKRFTMIITADNDQILIDGTNNGFSAIEIIGFLEAKKQDIIDQINHPEKYKYKRTAVVDGEVIEKEEVMDNDQT